MPTSILTVLGKAEMFRFFTSRDKNASCSTPEQADLVIEPIEARPLWQDSTWSQRQDDEAVSILHQVLARDSNTRDR